MSKAIAIVFLFLIVRAASAETSFPSCEHIRRSPDKNRTANRVLTEMKAIQSKVYQLRGAGEDLVANIRSGKVERTSGIQQLDSIKAESQILTNRSHELTALIDCIYAK
jgi:hypothetical protein